MVSEYKDQLETHITALEKGYENIIEILNEDIDKNDEGEITLKDDKIKTYADGVLKAAQTADELLSRIKAKKTELEELEQPKKNKEEPKEEQKQEKPKGLNGHLK